MKAIGKVVLNKKTIGWVDPINSIRLTIKNPEAMIYSNYNLTFIEKAAKEGRIIFIKF